MPTDYGQSHRSTPGPILREEYMKRTNKKFAPVLLTAAFAIGLVACGGDDGGSSSSSEAPSTEAPTSEAPSTEAPSDGPVVVDCAPEEGPLKAA